MLEVDGNQVRSSSGSCRSRRRETFSHRSSFEWEEGLRDIKPRGDQSFSVLDDYFQGIHHFLTYRDNLIWFSSYSFVSRQSDSVESVRTGSKPSRFPFAPCLLD